MVYGRKQTSTYFTLTFARMYTNDSLVPRPSPLMFINNAQLAKNREGLGAFIT